MILHYKDNKKKLVHVALRPQSMLPIVDHRQVGLINPKIVEVNISQIFCFLFSLNILRNVFFMFFMQISLSVECFALLTDYDHVLIIYIIPKQPRKYYIKFSFNFSFKKNCYNFQGEPIRHGWLRLIMLFTLRGYRFAYNDPRVILIYWEILIKILRSSLLKKMKRRKTKSLGTRGGVALTIPMKICIYGLREIEFSSEDSRRLSLKHPQCSQLDRTQKYLRHFVLVNPKCKNKWRSLVFTFYVA